MIFKRIVYKLNKKIILWILVCVFAVAAIWGTAALFNISILKGEAPTTSKLPEGTESSEPDVYQGVELDEKTYQGEVLSIGEESFTMRVLGEEVTLLFNDDSRVQFNLLEIEPGNVAMVEFSEEGGTKTATYVEKVISY